MRSEENARRDMIKAIDKQKAWVHVGMTYASSIAHEDYIKRRKNGLPDSRDNRGRLALAINSAIGDMIDFENIWKNRGPRQ